MRFRLAEKVALSPVTKHRRGTRMRALATLARRDRPVVTDGHRPSSLKWLLKKGRPFVARSLMEWANWFEKPDAKVLACTQVADREVSTIFMGIDHNLLGFSKTPVLWETLVFEPPRMGEFLGRPRMIRPTDSRWGGRYTSRAAALIEHDRIVNEIRKARTH